MFSASSTVSGSLHPSVSGNTSEAAPAIIPMLPKSINGNDSITVALLRKKRKRIKSMEIDGIEGIKGQPAIFMLNKLISLSHSAALKPFLKEMTLKRKM